MAQVRSHWGWGWVDRFPDTATRGAMATQLPALLGFAGQPPDDPVPLDQIHLVPPRIAIPNTLRRGWITGDPVSRIRHTYGRSYPDQLRGYRGDFSPAPDLVATPGDEAEVLEILRWASDADVAIVPRGGGTSVCGGVTPEAVDRPWIALSLAAMDQVVEVDPLSQWARVQAGILGPDLEAQLAEHGLTLRHYPQSFEFSTVGGWLATRAAGHFATRYTHIDDLTAGVRMVTPRGIFASRPLPGSGAGPSPDRWVLGSEGILGVITEATLRVRPRPTFRSRASVVFAEHTAAVEGVRRIAQARLYPSNCRLLDRREALLNGVPFDGEGLLLLGFESADHDVSPTLHRALEITADRGGICPEGPVISTDDAPAAASAWRSAFFDGPYLQSMLISVGVIADTFETAVPWDRFDALHQAIVRDVRGAMKDVSGHAFLSCRFTHVYPDGPAPYYTWIMPADRGNEIQQWGRVKAAASEAILAHGGTITHHHAVGRVHRPFYDRQRPALFSDMLAAAKSAMDPAGILNPGVLLPRSTSTDGD